MLYFQEGVNVVRVQVNGKVSLSVETSQTTTMGRCAHHSNGISEVQ